MSEQPAPAPHPAGPGFVHGLVHGVQLFAVAFLIALGVEPNRIGRNTVFIALAAGVRAVWAAFHH